MIALLSGKVVEKHLNRATILCGGLGLEFFSTPETIGTLLVGEETEVYTYLVVREDALTLYGFSQIEERDTFQILMQAKGIGPKVGLAALSTLKPSALANAISNRELEKLQKIPGIGKKSAERMVIEIGNKLDIFSATVTAQSTGGFNTQTVVEALTNLGWNQAQATAAVNTIEANDEATALREALKYLGSNC